MKKYIFSAILLFSIALFSHAQTGTWSGKLDVQGTKISLVFHLDEENPTMDSPDQGDSHRGYEDGYRKYYHQGAFHRSYI